MKIVFYVGYQTTPFSPELFEQTGLGGTEQSVIYLSYFLSGERNYEIFVVGDVIPGNYDGVKYRTTKQFLNEESYADVIIGVSYIHYIKEFENFNYKKSIFWLHNTNYYTWHNGIEIENHKDLLDDSKLTYIVCLTNWHKRKFLSEFPQVKEKTVVIGNGIEFGQFIDVWPKYKSVNKAILKDESHIKIKKNPNQYIYTSHCERGLFKIIEDWPKIKEKNPDAILKISTPEYGLEYYNLYCKELIENLPDVYFLGTLSRQKLYELMAESTYWYYPSQYEETFCITALEMLGHKVKPMTWEYAGLKETLQGFNVSEESELIDWDLVKNYLKKCTWESRTEYWKNLLNIKINMNLDYFYCITLQPEDNQPLYDKCNSFNMPGPFNYWPKQGFDFRKSSLEEYEKYGIKKHPRWKIDSPNKWYNREVTDGEVGCALSHIDCWVHSYAVDREICMILEEDFHPVTPIPWEQVSQLFDLGYDLIYLGRNAINPDKEKAIEGVLGWVEPEYSYNSHAYLLSRKAVEILVEEYIDQYKNEIFPFDEFLSILFAKTDRQDILNEYEGKTRLKAAAPIMDYLTQKDSPGLSNFNKDNIAEIQNANNWEEWCNKYINPHLRKGQYRLMVDEIGPNVIEFPLFTEKFCKEIIELAENSTWVTDRHEYYPTTDQTMEMLGMQRIYQRVLQEFVYPIWIWFWELAGDDWKRLKSENFIAKYDTLNQGSLDLHHDASQITLNVRLNSDFVGGGTYLPKYQKTLQPRKIGYAMSHPGQITHLHGGRPVEEGTRYILVTFTSKP